MKDFSWELLILILKSIFQGPLHFYCEVSRFLAYFWWWHSGQNRPCNYWGFLRADSWCAKVLWDRLYSVLPVQGPPVSGWEWKCSKFEVMLPGYSSSEVILQLKVLLCILVPALKIFSNKFNITSWGWAVPENLNQCWENENWLTPDF